jgi:hypothetical protein
VSNLVSKSHDPVAGVMTLFPDDNLDVVFHFTPRPPVSGSLVVPESDDDIRSG